MLSTAVVCVSTVFFLLSSSCSWVCWFYPPPTQMFVQLLANKNGSIQVWSTISCSLCFGIFFLLFNFDSSCMVLIWYIRSEWALSFYSPGNSICVFKVAVCALSVVLCLFLVQYNVIHQYISTRPHPVRAYLNVNIIRGRHHCLSFYLVPCCPI